MESSRSNTPKIALRSKVTWGLAKRIVAYRLRISRLMRTEAKRLMYLIAKSA